MFNIWSRLSTRVAMSQEHKVFEKHDLTPKYPCVFLELETSKPHFFTSMRSVECEAHS